MAKLGKLGLAGLLVLFSAITPLNAADILWQGGGTGSFSNVANWAGGALPGVGDRIVFSNDVVVDGVPTTTISGVVVRNSSRVSLGSTGVQTVTLSGGSGSTLEVEAGSRLTISGTSGNTLTVDITAGSGTVAGELVIQTTGDTVGTPPRILLRNPETITVLDGGVIAVASGGLGAGSGFGEASDGSVANGVVYESGARHVQGGFPDLSFNGGSALPPMVLPAPDQVADFRQDSQLQIVSGGYFLVGRRYANLQKLTGAAAVDGVPPIPASSTVIQDLTISTPAPHLPATYINVFGSSVAHTGELLTVEGNLDVASERAVFAFTSSSSIPLPVIRFRGNVTVGSPKGLKMTLFEPKTQLVYLDGSTHQILDPNGSEVPNLVIDNAAGVTLQSPLMISTSVDIQQGTLTAGPLGGLMLYYQAELASDLSGYTGPIGKSSFFDPKFTIPYVLPLTEGPIRFTATANTATLPGSWGAFSTASPATSLPSGVGINRTWSIVTNYEGSFAGNLEFTYEPDDIPVGVSPNRLVAARFDGENWQYFIANSSANVAERKVTVTGVTGFSVWTLVDYTVSDVEDWSNY